MGINLGTTSIQDVKLGDTQVDKIYLGNELVWVGGGETVPEWGRVKYYSEWVNEPLDAQGENVTVTSVNQQKLASFLEQYPSDNPYFQATSTTRWTYYYNGGTRSITNISTQAGITCSGQRTGSIIRVTGGIEIDYSSPIVEMELVEADYSINFQQVIYGFSQESIPRAGITEFSLGSEVTALPNYFLYDTQYLQKINYLPESKIASIGNYVFSKSAISNQPIEFPETLVTIGDYFLSGCSGFNGNITFSEGLVSIGGFFLQGCLSFNQEISLPSSLESVGNYFMTGCSSFNKPMDLENVETIGGNFLASCTSFNSEINMPNVEVLPDRFLAACEAFNQELDLGNITQIGASFLYGCTSFNKPLTFAKITGISYGFLYGCTSFNSPIVFEQKLTSISESFMEMCSTFNQNLELDDTIVIGAISIAGFLYNAKKYVSTIECNCAPSNTTSYNVLSTDDPTADMYTVGITLTGTYAAQWKNKFPDLDGTSSTQIGRYRKLILGQ